MANWFQFTELTDMFTYTSRIIDCFVDQGNGRMSHDKGIEGVHRNMCCTTEICDNAEADCMLK